MPTLCLWGSNYRTALHPTIVAQKRAIRLITGVPVRTHTSPLFRDLILKFTDLVQYQILNILHDFLRGKLTPVLAEKFRLAVYRLDPPEPFSTSQREMYLLVDT